jgi:hypothetical protein
MTVGGERPAERPEIVGDDVTALVGLVLEDRQLIVAVELDVAIVCGGGLRLDFLQARAVGGHRGAREELASNGDRLAKARNLALAGARVDGSGNDATHAAGN